MTETLSAFDAWLRETGPSAVIIKEHLEPATGPGSVIFPPTFAPPEGAKGESPGYIIDGEGENNVCLIDSVGSQANRLEPIFLTEPFRPLIPQVTVKVKERAVNLVELGHRVADAVIRSSGLAQEITAAFRAYENGNAVSLARLAPTSIVFGTWDSRESQVKIPRLISSTIRAYNVQKLERAAQYFAALKKDEVEELIPGVQVQKDRKNLSKVGFLDAPSGRTHGGVIVRGDIVKTTVLNLIPLRSLGAPTSEEAMALRRYILGLALVATTAPSDLFLRQGCLLVHAPNRPLESMLVYRDGRRESVELSLGAARKFAEKAAEDFGVGKNRETTFEGKLARDLIRKMQKSKGEN